MWHRQHELRRGLSSFTWHRTQQRHLRSWLENTDDMNTYKRKEVTFRTLRRYNVHRRAHLERLNRAEAYARDGHLRQHIQLWISWTVEAWEEQAQIQRAIVCHEYQLKKHSFERFYEHWAIHIGKERMKASICIQTQWRGKSARKQYAGMRVLNQYKVS